MTIAHFVSQGKKSGAELQSQLRGLREENSKLQSQLMEARAVCSPCPDGGPADLQPLEAVQQVQLVIPV